MRDPLPVLPPDTETIAELRELYRAAETRAARLRLLYVTGQDLAQATSDTLNDVLQKCADRLAFFVGCRAASIEAPGTKGGIAIHALGDDSQVVAALVIDGLGALCDITDSEDRDAVRMQLDMIGATIERLRRDSEKAELLHTLQEREKRLETMLDWIFTAQEDERRRVSHELHDGVAQTATALVRLLEGSEAAQPPSSGISPAEVARGLVSELRRVIAGMRPTLLDDLGLIPALRSLVEGLEKDGFTVTARLEKESVRLSPVVENALYRVAQEAIANIHKHAGGPCDVIIEARLSPDAKDRILRVIDFGSGPSEATRAAPQAGNNVGIEVMRERMTAIGGTLDWRAGKEAGVIVEARLPQQF